MPQASVFIPVVLPSAHLPSYVIIDTHSEWHRSALISTALESMTLSTRLRMYQSSRETLDQVTSALNINGNQNIAKLRMSVDQKAGLNGDRRLRRPEGQSKDARVPSQDRNFDDWSNPSKEDDVMTFDMDFFSTETGEQSRGRRNTKKNHVFGQSENYRKNGNKTEEYINDEEEDEGHVRARQRAAGLPIVHRSVPTMKLYTTVTPYETLNNTIILAFDKVQVSLS